MSSQGNQEVELKDIGQADPCNWKRRFDEVFKETNEYFTKQEKESEKASDPSVFYSKWKDNAVKNFEKCYVQQYERNLEVGFGVPAAAGVGAIACPLFKLCMKFFIK